jgi:hypothetical protein
MGLLRAVVGEIGAGAVWEKRNRAVRACGWGPCACDGWSGAGLPAGARGTHGTGTHAAASARSAGALGAAHMRERQQLPGRTSQLGCMRCLPFFFASLTKPSGWAFEQGASMHAAMRTTR